MPQSLSKVYLHTIFSTKDRYPFLSDPDLRAETHSYLAGIAKTLSCLPIAVGGVSDHVHLLTTFSRTTTIAEMVKELKRNSTTWLKERGDLLTKFHWQAGYGTFSVSQSNVDAVIAYIEKQEEHHRSMSCQDEFRRFLRKHGVEHDERYVWD